jgi:hypothetical protein
MANDSFSGGNTILWIKKDRLSWGGSLDPADPGGSYNRNSRFPAKPPTKSEIAIASGREEQRTGKEYRSFISQCVAAWEANELTKSYPVAPKSLRREIEAAGGNINWLAGNRSHQVLFHEICCRRRKENVPFDKIWGPGVS